MCPRSRDDERLPEARVASDSASSLSADQSSIWRRLAWMAAFWLGGVAAVGAVAFVIRFWLGL